MVAGREPVGITTLGMLAGADPWPCEMAAIAMLSESWISWERTDRKGINKTGRTLEGRAQNPSGTEFSVFLPERKKKSASRACRWRTSKLLAFPVERLSAAATEEQQC